MAGRLLLLNDHRLHGITSNAFQEVSRLVLEGGSWLILATGNFRAVGEGEDTQVRGYIRLDVHLLGPPPPMPPPTSRGDQMGFMVGSLTLHFPSGGHEYVTLPGDGSFTLVAAGTVPYGGVATGAVSGPPPPPPEPPRAVVSALKARPWLGGDEWGTYPGNIVVSEVQIVAHEVDQIKKEDLYDPIGTPPPFSA